jgi:hypothetical protein
LETKIEIISLTFREDVLRASTEQHRRDLKFATYRLIDMVGPGNLAAVTRVKGPALSKYAAQHEEEHFAPLDVVFDAERASGAMIVTEALARLHGMKLSPAEAGGSDVKAVRDHLETIEDSIAALRLAARAATADNHIDQRERRDLMRLIDAVKRELSELEGAL